MVFYDYYFNSLYLYSAKSEQKSYLLSVDTKLPPVSKNADSGLGAC